MYPAEPPVLDPMPIPEQTAQRWRARFVSSARQLVVILATSGGALLEAIAKRAGVALDTVYATVGRKPTLFRLLVEGAISGTAQPIPAEQRDYVRAIRAESRTYQPQDERRDLFRRLRQSGQGVECLEASDGEEQRDRLCDQFRRRATPLRHKSPHERAPRVAAPAIAPTHHLLEIGVECG